MGSRLGSYEILAPIGAGGMGEVYRARDAKLGRDVALKVLPEAFARDAERMARFQREAKVLASLDHPNIASIYGLEDSSSTHALVMQLIEGPTLADRIKQGPIPIDEALRIAKQICEALEYAHERGIIHRDLKPANVKVTSDDAVKVLDFGLAKALEGDASSMDISTSPTISRLATQAGSAAGDGGVHVARAGEGQSGGSPGGHLGVRLRAVRDADGEDGVQRRSGDGYAGGGDSSGTRLVAASGCDAGASTRAACSAACRKTRSSDCATSATPASRSTKFSPARPTRRSRALRKLLRRSGAALCRGRSRLCCSSYLHPLHSYTFASHPRRPSRCALTSRRLGEGAISVFALVA